MDIKKKYLYIVLVIDYDLSTCSKLQSLLLQQQTFLEKCETWMEFLVQTEENLAVEISGNFQSLMEQQKAHEVSLFLMPPRYYTSLPLHLNG